MFDPVKKIFNKWMSLPVSVRSTITALTAFAVNAVNAGVNLVLGIILSNLWLLALAGFYACLGFARGGIILRNAKTIMDKSLTDGQKHARNLHAYTFAGAFLFVMTAALIVIIVFIVRDGAAFEKSGLMIYYFAGYTTYKIIFSAISAGKARKLEDFSVKAIRNLNLADAVVSLLALQTALLSAFAYGADVAWANGVTGGCVCAFVLYLAVYMMVNSGLARKKLDSNS